jgi:rSAM/selenodomain-associated transferase 1
MAERIAIAVMARAPVAGQAKSRLIPALGAKGAAALQARLIERTVATAASAGIGPVTLWTTPDETHPLFGALRRQFGIALARQPDGDLGARMHAAIAAAGCAALVIGTDCPALSADHLHLAAATLRNYDVVVIPADDGGYV